LKSSIWRCVRRSIGGVLIVLSEGTKLAVGGASESFKVREHTSWTRSRREGACSTIVAWRADNGNSHLLGLANVSLRTSHTSRLSIVTLETSLKAGEHLMGVGWAVVSRSTRVLVSISTRLRAVVTGSAGISSGTGSGTDAVRALRARSALTIVDQVRAFSKCTNRAWSRLTGARWAIVSKATILLSGARVSIDAVDLVEAVLASISGVVVTSTEGFLHKGVEASIITSDVLAVVALSAGSTSHQVGRHAKVWAMIAWRAR
jgi:hypothetical protein